jgi:ferritin-like metal-binding protein YciE
MAQSETPARDAVLVKYLNEAYGKEKQLETALTAQIALAKRPQLKKGLQDHLKVTKAQSKGLAKRMKDLGGKADAGPDLPGPDVAGDAVGLVGNVANRALAAAKGPVQALRGTSEADNELRNVRDCLWNEAEEIAHYNVIEAAADALKDRETAKLARTYRRQEESMQKLLERQIAPLMKAVVKEEVPSAERGSSSRRSSSRSASTRSSSSRSSSSRSAASGSSSRRSASSKSAAAKTMGTRTKPKPRKKSS